MIKVGTVFTFGLDLAPTDQVPDWASFFFMVTNPNGTRIRYPETDLQVTGVLPTITEYGKLEIVLQLDVAGPWSIVFCRGSATLHEELLKTTVLAVTPVTSVRFRLPEDIVEQLGTP
jgi:hypothetical protein